MKYRKKPIVISAVQFLGNKKSIAEICIMIEDQTVKHTQDNTLLIPTLEGDMIANVNDYIIRGVNGEIYPCKPDIFEKTYDMVVE